MPLAQPLAAMTVVLALLAPWPSVAAGKTEPYLLTEQERALIRSRDGRPSLNLYNDQPLWAALNRVIPHIVGKTRGRYLGRPTSYRDAFYKTLGIPDGEDEIAAGRYLLTSGCRQHSCDEKGAVFADLQSGHVATALLHYINEKGVYHPIGTLLIMHKACADRDFVKAAEQRFAQWMKDMKQLADVRVATTVCGQKASR